MFRFALVVAFVFSFGAFAQDSTLLDDAIFQMRKFPTSEPIVGLLILEKDFAAAVQLRPSLIPRDTFYNALMVMPGASEARAFGDIESFAQRHKSGLVVFSPAFGAPAASLRDVRHFIKHGCLRSCVSGATLNDLSLLIDTTPDSILKTNLTAAQLLIAAGRPVERIGPHTLLIIKRSELAKILPAEESCNKVLSGYDTFNPFDHFQMHP